MSLLDLTSIKLSHTGPFAGAELLLAFFAWIIYLTYLRQKPIGFVFWFPFTALSALGSLLFLICAIGLIGAAMNPGGGEAAGFAVLGFGLATLYLIVCPIALIISVVFHPSFKATDPMIISITVLAVIFVFPLPFLVEQKIDALNITFTLLDPSHKPLSGSTVSKTDPPSRYQFWKTDENGRFSLQAKFDDIVTGGFMANGHKTIAYGFHTPPDASKPVDVSFYPASQLKGPLIISHAEYPITNGHDLNITYVFGNN